VEQFDERFFIGNSNIMTWYDFREPQLLKLQLKNVFASVGQRPAAQALRFVKFNVLYKEVVIITPHCCVIRLQTTVREIKQKNGKVELP